MKRNIAYLLVCLSLILSMIFCQPAARADTKTLDTSLLPEDTIAVVISPENYDHPRIIYAIYGVAKDDETLSISVRQISTDPQFTVYDEDVVNTNEQTIRWLNGFSKDQAIVGSLCEAYIEKDPDGESFTDRWSFCKQDSSTPFGHYMDEQFTFLLSELGSIDEKITFNMSFNCIPVPGTLDEHPACLFTIDIADYLNPVAMPALSSLDTLLIPEDTIAIFISPEKNNQPRIVYAVHGITKDEEFLFVNVRQISTDPQLVVYDDYLSNVSELYIRQTSEFTKDTPIVGSYCEALIRKDPAAEDFHDRWCSPEGGSIRPNGHYMDEQIRFRLSELKDIEGPIVLVLDYFCNPLPGDSSNRIGHEITIDLSDFLK